MKMRPDAVVRSDQALGINPDDRQSGAPQSRAAAAGHSRPNIVMRHYAHVLDERADGAADLISAQLGYAVSAEFAVNPVEA
jgi:hypothetical protein